jgi:hypothetical protein
MTRSADSRLVYQDQSAHELRLVLVNGPVDLEQFTVLDQASLTDPDGPLTVRASIIGASHCLEVIGNGQTFTEVFACCPVRSDVPTRDFDPWKSRYGLVSLHPKNSPVCEYICKPRLIEGLAIERLTKNFLETIARRRPNIPELGISYRFPSGSGERAPLTAIRATWQSSYRLLQVESLHDYPNEGLVALTITNLIINP